MILAIDTATRVASLALYDHRRVWAELTWHSRNNHTVELVPNLQRLLAGQGLEVRHLSGVVVGLGPGSFTGLRIGLSVAKGLAFAAGLPLVGVPTLDALAHAHEERTLPMWAILRAGRRGVCAAYYPLEGPWPEPDAYLLTTMDQLTVPEGERVLFCGEIEADEAEGLRERWGDRAVIAGPASALRRAGFLAELGWQRLQRGESDDLASLSPIYLRRPDIEGVTLQVPVVQRRGSAKGAGTKQRD